VSPGGKVPLGDFFKNLIRNSKVEIFLGGLQPLVAEKLDYSQFCRL
jgi:hypothetical protein